MGSTTGIAMRAYRIKAVLFDFDGTLTMPGAIDLKAAKQSIGCPQDKPLLEFIEGLTDDAHRSRARVILQTLELAAARQSHPNGGVEQLFRYLKQRRVPVGILTRNSGEAVATALKRFSHLTCDDFDVIITRDDPVLPKPSPEGVLLAAERFKTPVRHILLVGDLDFDIEAGRRAGALTALLDEGGIDPEGRIEADFRVSSLTEIGDIVRLGLPLPNGKFPSDLLDRFFGHLQHDDRRFLIKPGIGEDAAAIDMTGRDTLVVTSDPITFVTDRIGYYTVLINANDLATSGAVPEWLMTTLLFPRGATPSEILAVMSDIDAACRQWGITLCGGHTEVTDAVQRPVVVGTLGAAMGRADLIDKRNMRPGDRVLLTKGIAVEGTAIIAQAFGERLTALGMSAEELAESRSLVHQISILKEAAAARGKQGVTALHDVTEGGLATAVLELSCAGGHQLEIQLERIPVLPQTARICQLLGIDPLGLIGSGTLLMVCRPAIADDLRAEIENNGIAVACIGEVKQPGRGIRAYKGGTPADWPEFEVDEITRLF